jgi:hypothetical protein
MKLIEWWKHWKPIKFVREECLVGTELTSTYFNPWEISNSITD